MKQIHDIEIMAPVGCWESLAAALEAGATSVYFGIEYLNMRARSSANFTTQDLHTIVERCQAAGAKTYLTLNTVMYPEDLPLMREIVDHAKAAGLSAIIASDIAVLQYAHDSGVEVHLSTQLNIANTEALKFYAQYADVVVLARELNMEQVASIYRDIQEQDIRGPKGELIRIEMFCHGALCMAVSGKCYLSLNNLGASANRGACMQICRRGYVVKDKESDLELEVDNQYIMSPKDLKTIHFLNKMLDAGVRVLKIEGRARGAEYVKTVVECYKEAVDLWINNKDFWASKKALFEAFYGEFYNFINKTEEGKNDLASHNIKNVEDFKKAIEKVHYEHRYDAGAMMGTLTANEAKRTYERLLNALDTIPDLSEEESIIDQFEHLRELNSGLDEDEDGLWDIHEMRGMVLRNGDIVFTDPNIPDLDEDGLLDGEEILTGYQYNTEWVYGYDNQGNPYSEFVIYRNGEEFELSEEENEDTIPNMLFNLHNTGRWNLYTQFGDPEDEDADGDGLIDGTRIEVDGYTIAPLDTHPLEYDGLPHMWEQHIEIHQTTDVPHSISDEHGGTRDYYSASFLQNFAEIMFDESDTITEYAIWGSLCAIYTVEVVRTSAVLIGTFSLGFYDDTSFLMTMPFRYTLYSVTI